MEVSQLVKATMILRVAMSIICPLVLYFFDAIIVKGCVLNSAAGHLLLALRPQVCSDLPTI